MIITVIFITIEKLETTSALKAGGSEKQTVLHPYNGTLCGSKNCVVEEHSNTWKIFTRGVLNQNADSKAVCETIIPLFVGITTVREEHWFGNRKIWASSWSCGRLGAGQREGAGLGPWGKLLLFVPLFI